MASCAFNIELRGATLAAAVRSVEETEIASNPSEAGKTKSEELIDADNGS